MVLIYQPPCREDNHAMVSAAWLAGLTQAMRRAFDSNARRQLRRQRRASRARAAARAVHAGGPM